MVTVTYGVVHSDNLLPPRIIAYNVVAEFTNYYPNLHAATTFLLLGPKCFY
jgi:hypothetical protein